MQYLIVSVLLATASALPIEDTPEVAAAKASFKAAFDDAEAGGLAAKQAAQIPDQYLANDAEVEKAAAEFMAAFADAEAGGLAAKQAPAPVHVVPAPAPLATHAVAYAAAPAFTYAAAPAVTYSAAAPAVTYAAAAPAVTYNAAAPAVTYKVAAAAPVVTYAAAAKPIVNYAFSTYGHLPTFVAATAPVKAEE